MILTIRKITISWRTLCASYASIPISAISKSTHQCVIKPFKTASNKIFYSVLLALFFVTFLSSEAQAQTQKSLLTSQQKDFLAAYKSLKANDRQAIAKYKKKLKNYPLIVYINYHDYRMHMGATPTKKIKQFIAQNQDNYLGDKLYGKWLTYLAGQKKWTTFLNNYKPQKSLNLRCYHIQALANRKQTSKALKLAKPIWQDQIKLNHACKPLDKLIRNHKKLTGAMLWHRIELAMNKRKTREAKKLSKDLSVKDRAMLDYWLKVYKNPALIAKPLPKHISPPIKKINK